MLQSFKMIIKTIILDCPTCTNLEVLYGVRAVSSGRVPVYAIYREHKDLLNTLDVMNKNVSLY